MSTDQVIDELLRQDEAELRAKRKRLKTFASALEDARRANDAVRQSAAELMTAGDMSRADLVRVFDLTTTERGLLAGARKESGTAGDSAGEETPAGDHDAEQSEGDQSESYAAA